MAIETTRTSYLEGQREKVDHEMNKVANLLETDQLSDVRLRNGRLLITPLRTTVPSRMWTKMIAAVALAKIYGFGPVDRALATAAEVGRFADEDLAQLLRHDAAALPGKVRRLDEMRSLQTGTSAWSGFG